MWTTGVLLVLTHPHIIIPANITIFHGCLHRARIPMFDGYPPVTSPCLPDLGVGRFVPTSIWLFSGSLLRFRQNPMEKSHEIPSISQKISNSHQKMPFSSSIHVSCVSLHVSWFSNPHFVHALNVDLPRFFTAKSPHFSAQGLPQAWTPGWSYWSKPKGPACRVFEMIYKSYVGILLCIYIYIHMIVINI